MLATKLGKYELRGELGRGAMGIVYRAYDPALDREVALKTMSGVYAGDPDEAARFHREAASAGKLSHPNIVTIYEFGDDAGVPFIAMELLDGTTLAQLIERNQLPPYERRLAIVAQVCEALDYAHQRGVVHRDIKPANVAITKSGVVKLLDFGIAKLAATDATKTGMVLGSPDYMSPEQVHGDRTLDGRSDIFAAGSILYELLFLRRPFASDSIATTMYKIAHASPDGEAMLPRLLPPALWAVLARAMQKDRDKRYRTASEMARALEAVTPAVIGESGALLERRIAGAMLDGSFETTEVGGATRLISSLPTVAVPEEAPKSRAWLYWMGALVIACLAIALWPTHDSSPEPASRATITTPAPTLGPGDAVPELTFQRGGPAVQQQSAAPSAAPEPEPRESDPAAAGAHPQPAAATDSIADTQDTTASHEPSEEAAVAPSDGQLALSVLPWARIEAIQDTSSGKTLDQTGETPLVLSLPPSTYRIQLQHPSLRESLWMEVEIRAGELASVTRSMPGLEPAQMVSRAASLLGEGGSGSRGARALLRPVLMRWDQALKAYFAGDFEQSADEFAELAKLTPQLPGPKVLEGAARFHQWVAGGERNEALHQRAMETLREAKRIEPGYELDSRMFAPRLIEIWGRL